MRDFELCKELSKKLSKDLGATPFSIRKTGITDDSLLVKRTLKIQDENNEVKNIPVWYGEAKGLDSITCCLLTLLDESDENFEVACIIGFKDFDDQILKNSIRVGFRYDWGNPDDYGTLIVKLKDKWVPVDLSRRLQLNLAFENMVQDGILFEPSKEVPEDFFENISEIIEVDEET